MAEYAAFLRAINVGGHKPVPMHALKKALESLKFTNVKTLLASGNVVFEASRGAPAALEKTISEKLKKSFGFEIPVLVRTKEELQKLSDADPFKGIRVPPQARIFVTFLQDKPGKHSLSSTETRESGFKILSTRGREVFSIVTAPPGSGTTDLMKVLEKKYGKQITTRSWQTVLRMLDNR
jgi:uncharacterized protein (DUF1697 family)